MTRGKAFCVFFWVQKKLRERQRNARCASLRLLVCMCVFGCGGGKIVRAGEFVQHAFLCPLFSNNLISPEYPAATMRCLTLFASFSFSQVEAERRSEDGGRN